MEVLKYEYILIKTGSDDILRKNVDGAHLHHKEILHAKFGKYRTVRFRSSARVRTYIHTYIRTRYSVHAIMASPYRSCTKKVTMTP